MEINTIEISGFVSTLQALRLPFGLTCRSYTNFKNYNKENQDYFLSCVNIYDKDLLLLKNLVKAGPEHAKCIRGINVYAEIIAPVYFFSELETYTIGHYRLASESTMHIDCKGLEGSELQEYKANIPMGRELKKIDMFNYQNLRNIYFQRRYHRLPEWHQFCEWIESLPYSSELITIK